jgi:hypothetical protein
MARNKTNRERMPLATAIAMFADRPTDCWDWPGGYFHHGYGRVFHDGKQRLSHKVAYEVLVGPVPEGLELDHGCRNRRCFNPRHLEPVTHRVNSLRSHNVGALNARKTHCKHGHEFTPQNTRMRKRRRGLERVCRQCVLDETHRRRARHREVSGFSTNT